MDSEPSHHSSVSLLCGARMDTTRAIQDIFADFVFLFLIWIEPSSGSTNLALLHPATQSASSSLTGPDKAVDGFNNTAQDVANNLYCTFVETVGQPVPGWWQVDIQVTVRVGSVRITPAQYDYGLPKDFQLVVYPDAQCPQSPKLCFEYTGIFSNGVAETIYCSKPVRGRFVRFIQNDPLFLCEVEVYEYEAQTEFKDAIFMQIPEKKFDLTGPVEMETRSALDCARSCLQLGSCPAFNYRSDSRVCEVSSNGNSSGLTAGNPVWDAYELDLCLDN
ncbi:uncharacterized protein LOC124138618 [Haliotis rufescens]|uniref:uncharacterized protein LOC124138618 n=1 Tax=Haliotis rufescens TaxID=6454 RepID=UPI00201F27C2|nr:uncharacterized protein LOC124138618 [Haliotis rufescens]